MFSAPWNAFSGMSGVIKSFFTTSYFFLPETQPRAINSHLVFQQNSRTSVESIWVEAFYAIHCKNFDQLESVYVFTSITTSTTKKDIFLYHHHHHHHHQKHADSTDFIDSLLPTITISHCSWKVLLTASSICTELMNECFYWSPNSGVSMCWSSWENVTYDFILTFSNMSFLYYLDVWMIYYIFLFFLSEKIIRKYFSCTWSDQKVPKLFLSRTNWV